MIGPSAGYGGEKGSPRIAPPAGGALSLYYPFSPRIPRRPIHPMPVGRANPHPVVIRIRFRDSRTSSKPQPQPPGCRRDGMTLNRHSIAAYCYPVDELTATCCAPGAATPVRLTAFVLDAARHVRFVAHHDPIPSPPRPLPGTYCGRTGVTRYRGDSSALPELLAIARRPAGRVCAPYPAAAAATSGSGWSPAARRTRCRRRVRLEGLLAGSDIETAAPRSSHPGLRALLCRDRRESSCPIGQPSGRGWTSPGRPDRADRRRAHRLSPGGPNPVPGDGGPLSSRCRTGAEDPPAATAPAH